ncbi:MAG TPA: hypothetical protein PLT66_09540, partial [Bacillota bacterium]|nr:hypothetical protein [Bacillota bacterium]
MNTRERILNILHYKDIDQMPAVHFGYWPELLLEWAQHGKISYTLARGWADGNEAERELDKIIGWDTNWFRVAGTANGLYPSFEQKVLETLPNGMQRIQSSFGLIERIMPGIASIPSEEDYLLKDRKAFDTLFRPKLKYLHERVNTAFFKSFNETRPADLPYGIMLGSVLGDIRNMTSVIGMSYLMYDEDEALFADIVDTYAD